MKAEAAVCRFSSVRTETMQQLHEGGVWCLSAGCSSSSPSEGFWSSSSLLLHIQLPPGKYHSNKHVHPSVSLKLLITDCLLWYEVAPQTLKGLRDNQMEMIELYWLIMNSDQIGAKSCSRNSRILMKSCLINPYHPNHLRWINPISKKGHFQNGFNPDTV